MYISKKTLLKPGRPDTCISVKTLLKPARPDTCISVKNLTQARETRYMYISKKPYSSYKYMYICKKPYSSPGDRQRHFQQCGILTSVDSGETLQPPFKLRNSGVV